MANWDVVAINCTDSGLPGASFLGGSILDKEAHIAYSRAHNAGYDPINCVTIFKY
jgi:hypothetical protein